jgi:integrase
MPIGDSVLPVLRAMKLARGGDGASGMPWPGVKPGRARNKSSVFRPFKAAVKRAKLDPALSPHDLRHIFASHDLAAAATSSSCRASWATRAWP